MSPFHKQTVQSGLTLINRRSIKAHTAGFTLIELMVVLVILAIMMVVVFYLLMPSLYARSRDTRRLADIEQITKGIFNYSTDKGHFPPLNPTSAAWSCGITVSAAGDCKLLVEELRPYLGVDAYDPQDGFIEAGDNNNCSNKPCYMYTTSADRNNFCLCVNLETDPPQTKSDYCNNLTGYGNYCTSNHGN